MTYFELKHILMTMTDSELDMNVTVQDLDGGIHEIVELVDGSKNPALALPDYPYLVILEQD